MEHLGLRILDAILWRSARVGIRVRPFLVVREGAVPVAGAMDLDPRFSAGFIGPGDIPELVRVHPDSNAETCAQRLRQGHLCYALKDGDRIVAKMWCDLQEFSFPPNQRRLEDREAYLYDAYTDPAYRGQNLAPLMRLHCYAALREMGRNVFYSFTDYCNSPARRFKQKLGATDESLRVCIALFGCRPRTFTLWRY